MPIHGTSWHRIIVFTLSPPVGILHHFIAAGVWDATPVETELLVQADRLVGGSDAVLVIDDTAIPKKGTHSVGVAPQYASALGKTANCQTLVSLTLARGEVPVVLALRLFLPESWTSKRSRLERAGVPAECRTARTKPEMALAEIDRAIAAGVRFGFALADAGYGLSAPFRQGLTARKLAWAVGIPRHLKVYLLDAAVFHGTLPIEQSGEPVDEGAGDLAVDLRRIDRVAGIGGTDDAVDFDLDSPLRFIAAERLRGRVKRRARGGLGRVGAFCFRRFMLFTIR